MKRLIFEKKKVTSGFSSLGVHVHILGLETLSTCSSAKSSVTKETGEKNTSNFATKHPLNEDMIVAVVTTI